MTVNHDEDGRVREAIKQLQLPVSDVETLLSLLAAPLDCLGLLPPRFRQYNTHPLPEGSVIVRRHIPVIQRALLEHVQPTWGDILSEQSALSLLDQYFCPDSFHFSLAVSGSIALQAFSTILSTKMSDYSVRLLERLTKHYPLDRIHSAIFQRRRAMDEITWEDYVQNSVAVPPKVANYLGRGTVSELLQQGKYFNHMATRFEALVAEICTSPPKTQASLPSLTYLLVKWVNLGLFPPKPPILPSEPSFFKATLPTIRERLPSHTYSRAWSQILFGIPSMIATQSVTLSLFGSIDQMDFELEDSERQRAAVKREAVFLRNIFGVPAALEAEQLDAILPVVLGHEFRQVDARIFVCWFSDGDDTRGIKVLLDAVISRWYTPEHIKHSLLSHHRYLTTLLLLTVCSFEAKSPVISNLVTDGRFISGVTAYISHMDKAVRVCGMLSAEIVASRAGKELNFDLWEGDEPEKFWARQIRKLLQRKDKDADILLGQEEITDVNAPNVEEVEDTSTALHAGLTLTVNDLRYDSDDSITGYASSPASSRSPSPTPSEMEEREKDPSLNVTAKKVSRPIYLVQLGELLREPSSFKEGDGAYEADQMETALRDGAALIRRKQFFGTELEETCVNLVYGYLNLSNKYELENFEDRCQDALAALVACCPHKAAPCIAEEFFKNQYSISQRYMMLNALVLGSRELSSTKQDSLFPSKLLSPALHQKYLAANDSSDMPVPRFLAETVRSIENTSATFDPPPSTTTTRTRRLRLQKPRLITEDKATSPCAPTYTSVAAEHFIGPLMNRFWLFLRDEQTREERTAHLKGRQQYYGAGNGLVLNPSVLGYFISSIAVLVHLSRNALEWSAFIAPEVLELALAVGMRPISRLEEEEAGEDDSDVRRAGGLNKQASVLTSVLQLILVVLDAALEADDGKSLSLEHGSLVLGVEEWASALFDRLDSGERAQGMGGLSETNLPKICAAVVIKADAVTSKWRRSMVDVM